MLVLTAAAKGRGRTCRTTHARKTTVRAWRHQHNWRAVEKTVELVWRSRECNVRLVQLVLLFLLPTLPGVRMGPFDFMFIRGDLENDSVPIQSLVARGWPYSPWLAK